MVDFAVRLNRQYCEGDTLEVEPVRRLRLFGVVEGIAAEDNWTDVFEPVRRRRFFSGKWRYVQQVGDAGEHIEAFLRERPDLDDRR
jgi:hypothetical protein